MPNIASAKKRVRQDLKRTARNRVRKERLKKAMRAFDTAVAGGDAAVVKEELRKITKAIDKAGDKGILHSNAVNRQKAQVAKKAATVG